MVLHLASLKHKLSAWAHLTKQSPSFRRRVLGFTPFSRGYDLQTINGDLVFRKKKKSIKSLKLVLEGHQEYGPSPMIPRI